MGYHDRVSGDAVGTVVVIRVRPAVHRPPLVPDPVRDGQEEGVRMTQAGLGAEWLDPLLQFGAAEHRGHVSHGEVARLPYSLKCGAIRGERAGIPVRGRGAGGWCV